MKRTYLGQAKFDVVDSQAAIMQMKLGKRGAIHARWAYSIWAPRSFDGALLGIRVMQKGEGGGSTQPLLARQVDHPK